MIIDKRAGKKRLPQATNE